MTPTATPTTVSNTPRIDTISPTEATEGTNTNFQLYGADFVEPSTVEVRPVGGSGAYTPIPASRITFGSSTHITFNYEFRYYSQFDIRVTGSTGASNAVLLTIVAQPENCDSNSSGTYGLGSNGGSPVMQSIFLDPLYPCQGDQLTLSLTISPTTPATGVYFRLVTGSTCQPPIYATEVSPNTWQAQTMFSGNINVSYGILIVSWVSKDEFNYSELSPRDGPSWGLCGSNHAQYIP
ncbi:MAG: hypothetical protein IH609_11725 [Dehalococcoidia bacterium]|nr:hypothetical protein [Dehalococcoidia bacterium]